METASPETSRGQGRSNVSSAIRKVINLRRPVQILRRLRASSAGTSLNALPPLYTTALDYSTGSTFINRSQGHCQGQGYYSRSNMSLKFPQSSLLSSSVSEEAEDDDDSLASPRSPLSPSVSENSERVLKRLEAIDDGSPNEITPLTRDIQSPLSDSRLGLRRTSSTDQSRTRDYLTVTKQRRPKLQKRVSSYASRSEFEQLIIGCINSGTLLLSIIGC